MSFSYMTFVIKEERTGHNMDDFLFDVEGYDFVFFKKTILL